MPFQDAILAGNTLVRDSIKSENYVAGSAGWQITRDGNAEFYNLTSRGSFVSGNGTGPHVEIPAGVRALIRLHTGDSAESPPGQVASLESWIITPHQSAQTQFQATDLGGGASSIIFVTSSVTGKQETQFVTDKFWLVGALVIDTNETWNAFPLVNSWITSGGYTPRYRKDVSGNTHIQARIGSGTSGLIGTLPVGYRPTQVLDFPVKCNSDAGSVAWLQIGTNGALTILGNFALAQTNVMINLTFSTL